MRSFISTASGSVLVSILLLTAVATAQTAATASSGPVAAPAAPEMGWVNTTQQNGCAAAAGGKPAKWFTEAATRRLAKDLVELDSYRTIIVPGAKAAVDKALNAVNLLDVASAKFKESIQEARDGEARYRGAYEKVAIDNERLRSKSSVWPFILGVVTGLAAVGLGALGLSAIK